MPNRLTLMLKSMYAEAPYSDTATDGAPYLLSVNRFQFYRKSVRNYSLVRGSAKSASKASRGLMDLPDWRSFAHFLTASKVNLTTEGCCVVASCPDSLTLSD